MGKTIRVRRNTIANIPTLQMAEPFWATDTNTLYVGDGSANHLAVPSATLSSLGLNANLATFSPPASTTISAFGKTLVDDETASAARATLGIGSVNTAFVYPEDYGATGDGVTDDYTALKACFDAVIAATYKPKIVFKAAKYAYGTGLTINFAQGMSLLGCGGFWTPSDAGYSGKVTTLYYTGNGVALTIDGSVNNGTGFVMEQIYLQGTSSATGGLYINTASGMKFRDMTVGKFTGISAYGIKQSAAQVNTFTNIGLVDNFYGLHLDGASNVRNTFYDCVWHSNTYTDIYDTGSFQTILVNPLFQNGYGNAIWISIGSGVGVSEGMTIYNPYFEGCASTYPVYVVEVVGDASAQSKYYKHFSIHGGSYSGGGAAEVGFIRCRYTTKTTFDNIQHNATSPSPVYTIDPALNSSVTFYRLDPGITDADIEDGDGNAAYWTKHYCDGRTSLSQGDTGQAASLLHLKHSAPAGPFVNFDGTEAASSAKNISTWTTATLNGFVRVMINGVAKWMPYYNSPTS